MRTAILLDTNESHNYFKHEDTNSLNAILLRYKPILKEIFTTNIEENTILNHIRKYHRVNLIKSDEAEILLKSPLQVEIELEDDFYIAYNSLVNITAQGESMEEALENFADFFIFDYKNYKNTPSNKLSSGAKKLLVKYKSIIKTDKWL